MDANKISQYILQKEVTLQAKDMVEVEPLRVFEEHNDSVVVKKYKTNSTTEKVKIVLNKEDIIVNKEGFVIRVEKQSAAKNAIAEKKQNTNKKLTR